MKRIGIENERILMKLSSDRYDFIVKQECPICKRRPTSAHYNHTTKKHVYKHTGTRNGMTSTSYCEVECAP